MNCSSCLFLQGLDFGLGLVWGFSGFAFAGGGGGRKEMKRLGKETQRIEDLKSRDRKTEQAHSLSFLCTFFSIVKGMRA